MDVIDTSRTTVKDIPPVPIKTYQWEDVRRAKNRGFYPYTHLSKDPFNEEVDPREFTMDSLKAKSSVSLHKSSSGVQIQEVTEEPKDQNGKCQLEVEGIVESADSSAEDNISQYLDKDEDKPTIVEQEETPGPSTEKQVNVGYQNHGHKEDTSEDNAGDDNKENEQESMEVDEEIRESRAKSEEPKRKRKLSIESAYSRISLSRLGVMKKLRAAKDKLKLPKIPFSKSEPKLDESKKPKKFHKQEKKSSREATKAYLNQPRSDENPVYIHIPLKPPPGQTDEFSYLEFEDRKAPSSKPDESTTTKQLTTKEVEATTSAVNEITNDVQFIILTAPSDDEILDDHIIVPDSASSDNKKFFDGSKLKDLKSLAKGCVDDISPDTKIDGIIFEDVIQVEYVDEHNNPIGTTERSSFLEINDETLPTIEKQLSKRNIIKELQKELTASMDSINKLARQRSLRQLSEKSRSSEALKALRNKGKTTQEAPELSQFSNLGGMKKTLSLKETKRRLPATNRENRKSAPIEQSTKIQDIKLEKFEPQEINKQTTKESTEQKHENIVNQSLDMPKSSVKRTPNPTQELQEIPTDSHKDVKQIKEESRPIPSERKDIMVDEEDGLKLSETAIKMINEELAKEDLPKTTEEQIKSSLKASDSLKKKVSFKRRSKQADDGVYEDVKVTDGKDGKVKDLKVMDSSQSMSVDEEKTYLDEKIIKTTSLEEDYNKWSKLTDHEYEPVNPPADGQGPPSAEETPGSEPNEVNHARPLSIATSIRIPLADDVIVQTDDRHIESDEPLAAEELQARIEDQFFNQPQIAAPATTPDSKSVSGGSNKEPQESHAKKIHDAFRNQATKIRTKFKNIKKPTLPMPQKPNFAKFNVKKPNINFPKIPDQMKVNLPSFTLPKKTTVIKTKTTTTKERQYSTESNVGEPKRKIFDFSTYPRIFSKKKGNLDDDLDAEIGSSTVPRTKKDGKKKKESGSPEKKRKPTPDVVRIPLHSEESMDREDLDLSSHRYDEDIELENDYVRESQEMHRASPFTTDFSRNRWNHGSFHGHNLHEIANDDEVKVTDLDNDLDIPQETQIDQRSRSSSGDVHRRGVLEEINSDEFFLRQKGISQDNIEMGAYLTSEIREAFRQPGNSLSQMRTDDSFDREIDSEHGLKEQRESKRRPIKKPKRKKTPNVSRERIPYDQESPTEPEEYPQPKDQPTRPKRRSKKRKETIPYQETIPLDVEILRKSNSDNILIRPLEDEHHFYDGDFRKDYPQMYENEQMQGREQPNILLSDPHQEEEMIMYVDEESMPEAPPRKQKSLKSLNSEHDSIINELNYAKQPLSTQEVESYRLEHEYIIPTPEERPTRPTRTRSRTRSQSRATNQPDEEIEADKEEPPCVEEPCVQKTCDYMGYAVIDKTKQRDPPLPPPPRKKRSQSDSSGKNETKFFTCPRPLKSEAPIRPLRNYSTLVPKQKRRSSIDNELIDEKENIDLRQYIEIEDGEEHTRLQSGDVLKKMKDRPLPAPPRPPRKQKDGKSPLSDITNESNIEETEVSVQTEPLSDDFVCEELIQEKGDKIITPTQNKPQFTEFEHQETVTHGALIVAPISDDFQEGPISNFSRSTEKVITIRREVDHEDTSDVPEDFKKLRNSPKLYENRDRSLPDTVSILKAQKLQVTDLDVDRLTVNELLASKIRVSEIDSDSIRVSEINPESASVSIGGIELPARLLQDILNKLQQSQTSTSSNVEVKSEKSSQSIETKGNVEPRAPDSSNIADYMQKVIGVEQEDIKDMEEEIIKEKITDKREVIEEVNYGSEVIKETLEEEYVEGTPIEQRDEQLENELRSIQEIIKQEDILREQVEDMLRQQERALASEIMERLEHEIIVGEIEEMNFQPPTFLPDSPISEESKLIEHQTSEQKKTPIEEDAVPINPPPIRPPRHSHRIGDPKEDFEDQIDIAEEIPELILGSDSTPPPRPPEPFEFEPYIRSQPPPSFYLLRSPQFNDFIDEDIPLPPRRKRPQRPPSESTSEEAPPTPRGRRQRTPEPSIPQLAGQLTRACLSASEKAFKRLVKHITMNVLHNSDGRQDLHVMVVILLVLIAGLLLLSSGDKTVHMHHWEYFNPPKDL